MISKIFSKNCHTTLVLCIGGNHNFKINKLILGNV